MNHVLIANAIQPEDTTKNQVVAPRVAGAACDTFLPELLPALVLIGESTIYAKPDQLSSNGQSVYRDFYTPINDGERYPASAVNRTFQPTQPGNCFAGKAGTDANSVFATRHARSGLFINHPGTMLTGWPSVPAVIS